MSNIDMRQFICLEDNYGVLLHDPKTGATASIDAPDADQIEAELRKYGRQLTHIFNTHHHDDHVRGNLQLKERFGCKIIGPRDEASKIPGIDIKVAGGDSFDWAGYRVDVFACPGHTLGHIAFHIPDQFSLFAGDTLFSLGCGRVFEGTMAEMYRSVNQFRNLSPNTYLYCGHEYTLSNSKFALAVDPNNRALQLRAQQVAALRAKGEMTCPVTLAEEFVTNPFLRCDDAAIRYNLGLEEAPDEAVFAELRERKNNF